MDSFINTFDYISGSGKKTRQLNFLVQIKDGEISLNPDEHTEFYWLDPTSTEFESLNISDETKNVIKISLLP